MGIDKLERVMWRLRKRNPKERYVTNKELQIATIKECGYSDYTLRTIRKTLIKLGWIKSKGKRRIEITDKDLIEE